MLPAALRLFEKEESKVDSWLAASPLTVVGTEVCFWADECCEDAELLASSEG